MEHERHIAFGPFRFDMTHGRLWRGEQVTGLRLRSLAMPRRLVEHHDRLASKAELHAHVWSGTYVNNTALRMSVKEIRAPLGDVAAYVTGRLGGPVAPLLTEFVHECTDGNAPFMVNIVGHPVLQGLVVRREDQRTPWQGAEAKVVSLPEGLRQLIVRRIEGLPPETRRVPEAASNEPSGGRTARGRPAGRYIPLRAFTPGRC